MNIRDFSFLNWNLEDSKVIVYQYVSGAPNVIPEGYMGKCYMPRVYISLSIISYCC